MILTKISAVNVKGWTGSMDLKQITAIIGSNFRGKTSRTDAIRLALLGYLPELGKTNQATFQLSSGREMTVEAVFEEPAGGAHLTCIRRKWWLEGNSVKAAHDVAPPFDTAPLAVMLDPQVYFSLSDRERVNFVARSIQMPDAGGRTIEDVEADIATAVDTEKTCKAYAKRMEETVRGLGALKAQDQAEPVNLDSLAHERHAFANKIVGDQVVVLKLQQAKEAAEKHKGRRAFLEQQINLSAQAETQLQSYKDRLHEAQDDLGKLGDVDDLSTVTLELDAARRLVDTARGVIAGGQSRLKQIAVEQDTLTLTTKCPWCGAEGEGWRDSKRQALMAEATGIVLQNREEDGKLPELTETVRLKNDALTTLKAKRAKAEELRRAIKDLQRNVDTYQQAVTNLVARRDELAQLPAVDDTIAQRLLEADRVYVAKKNELAALDAKITAAQGRQQDQKRQAEAEGQRDKAKEDQAAASDALVNLRVIQAQMVEAAFKPLLETANSIFGQVLRYPLEYFDGEIGMTINGIFAAHSTFSGTEKALAYAAIQAALTQASPVKIMIIDELGRLDDRSLDRLINGVFKAVRAGTIDQFVGIDTGRLTAYDLHSVTEDITMAIEQVV